MQELPENRHTLADAVWRLWRKLDAERYSDGWSEKDNQRTEVALNKLAQLCVPEIAEAFQENGIQCLSRVGVKCVAVGVDRAARTKAEHPDRHIYEHVKACVATALAECIEAFDRWFYQAEATELLNLLSHVPQPVAKMLVGRTTLQQAQQSLYVLIMTTTGGHGVFYQPPLNQEPRNRLDWLAQCLFVRIVADSGVRQVTETSAKQGRKVILLVDSDGRLKSRRNQDSRPPDLAGPLHVKMSGFLSRQLSKRPDFPVRVGNINKGELGGISNMAQSLKVGRSRVRGWREREDELPKVYQDGNGVSVDLTADDVWHIAVLAYNRKAQHS